MTDSVMKSLDDESDERRSFQTLVPTRILSPEIDSTVAVTERLEIDTAASPTRMITDGFGLFATSGDASSDLSRPGPSHITATSANTSAPFTADVAATKSTFEAVGSSATTALSSAASGGAYTSDNLNGPGEIPDGAIGAIVVGIVLTMAALMYAAWSIVQSRRKGKTRKAPNFSSLSSSYDNELPMRDLPSDSERRHTRGSAGHIPLDGWMAAQGQGSERVSACSEAPLSIPKPEVAETQSFTKDASKPRMCNVGHDSNEEQHLRPPTGQTEGRPTSVSPLPAARMDPHPWDDMSPLGPEAGGGLGGAWERRW